MSDEKMIFEQFVSGSTAEVYLAFTNATLLRRWMCDVATVSTKMGGRFYVAWNNGFYASGEYTRLEAERSLGFSWFGRGDPAQTQVEVTLNAQSGGTIVRLEHSGLGSGSEWASTRKQAEMGWKSLLQNLASVIGSGEDLRITQRPMLGVLFGELNEEVARELGVPVTQGVHLGGVVDGFAAASAGLRKGDVLVSMDGQELEGWGDLGPILQSHKAGDPVEVIYYRGAAQQKVVLELSRRNLPEIPDTVAGLAAVLQETYDQMRVELERLFDGVSEAEASYRPSPEAWSIKDILAHLIHSERNGHDFVFGVVGNQEQWADDFPGNLKFRIDGTLAAFPELADLLAELKRLYIETVGLYAALPVDLPEHKASYWFLAYNTIQPQYHFLEHTEEIRGLIAAARSA
jgi:uncharacterized protein YndB with AHSA1/START domain